MDSQRIVSFKINPRKSFIRVKQECQSFLQTLSCSEKKPALSQEHIQRTPPRYFSLEQFEALAHKYAAIKQKGVGKHRPLNIFSIFSEQEMSVKQRI